MEEHRRLSIYKTWMVGAASKSFHHALKDGIRMEKTRPPGILCNQHK